MKSRKEEESLACATLLELHRFTQMQTYMNLRESKPIMLIIIEKYAVSNELVILDLELQLASFL